MITRFRLYPVQLMYIFHFLSIIIILFSTVFVAKASIDTSTAIFDPLFRTLTVTKNNDLMLDPVLDLNGRSSITISFDEIANDRSYLRCRLIHCNADWQPSMLQENEYVSGFNFMDIEDFGFSSNTFIHYVNYHLTIPNEYMTPLKSGNYLLQVFDRYEPDTTLLQVRFKVSEEKVIVGGIASGRTDMGFNDVWQQLSLTVDPGNFIIPNPYTDLIVTVEQNRHPDSRRVINHPMSVQGTKIIYEHQPELIFKAGNEYRRFEIVRTNYPGMGIDSTRYAEPMYHAWLKLAEKRADSPYTYDSTQRGRFKIDEYNSTDPDLGADYILTHFTLDFPEIIDGDIYVDGELFLNSFSDNNRMIFDRNTGLYNLSTPLKQGSYNYRYVVRARGENAISDATPIEGDKYETLNEYNISVYLRQPGSRADRLLGTATIVARP